MVRSARLALVLALTPALLGVAACGQDASDRAEGTITVWDYYGSSTPVKPAIAAFETAHPNIKVDYQAYDYETMQEKFSTAVASGTAPDVATLDMTWIPTYAANSALSDLSGVSGGKLNGSPIDGQYAPGALESMRYQGKYVTALYDFDAYALYYRKDLFDKAHIAVPKTWAELNQTAAQLSAAAPSPGKHRMQILPDTFHFAQFLYQAGGDLLDGSEKKAVFNSPAGVRALTYYRDLLNSGGLYWGEDQGDSTGIAGIKDERIAMFLNGPYMMGILKDGAPDQAGKWAVAPAPVDAKAGSYLGGTGLSIPSASKHKAAAWTFIEFLLRPEQQLNVAKTANAAPATTAALSSPQLTEPDPYFGGQKTFPVFLSALGTARHFPYVSCWTDIDKAVSDATVATMLGKKTPQQALDDAAKEVDGLLRG